MLKWLKSKKWIAAKPIRRRGEFIKNFIFAGLLLGLVIFPLGLNTSIVLAQDSPAGDLISAVNALRAASGLPAYEVDSALNTYAQAYAELGAVNGCESFNHQRPDGTFPHTYRYIENIACGTDLTLEDVLNKWNNTLNMHTMVGIEAGYIGAGVAVSGDMVFYVLDVKKPYTPEVSGILVTSTPDPDGSIWHFVGNGQSLATIAQAYGVTIREIQDLNELSSSIFIYSGQELLIRAGITVTNTPTATATKPSTTPTIEPQTRTATLGQPTDTIPSPTKAVQTQTLTPTSPSSGDNAAAQPDNSLPRRIIGIILILVCSTGLVVIYLENKKSGRKFL
jgi:hypothetical protein